MEWNDILSLVFSSVAFLVSLSFTLIYRSKLLGIQYANAEMVIRTAVSNARSRVEDFTLEFAKLPEDLSDEKQEALKKALSSRVENVINTYEEACMKYIDNKIDKKRFRKSFQKEIRQLVEDTAHEAYFKEPQSHFHAILKLYKEWENLEN